ncbi:MAG: hypothetical protein HY903_10810 [Deltaproteobacteria bacterium]|nr:hypothetical protein [Deltaproteobacteria bacterium]
MKRIVVLCAVGVLGGGCGSKTSTITCPGGQVAVGEQCRTLCKETAECALTETCGADGYCIPSDGPKACSSPGQCLVTEQCDVKGYCVSLDAVPQIDRVTGDRGDGTVNAALKVEGARLTDATARLIAGAQSIALDRCSGGDAQLLLDLPATVTPGTYELAVTNAGGTCSQTVQLLQGSADTALQVYTKLNQALTDDSTRTIRGMISAGKVTTLIVQAEGGAASRAIKINSAEPLVGTPNVSNVGMAVVVIDRATQAVKQKATAPGYPDVYNPYGSNLTDFVTLLTSLQSDVIVLLASKGNIVNGGSTMSTDAGLRVEIHRLGGSTAFDNLTATQGYVLIGIPGVGAGKGIEMVADGTVSAAAVTTLLIDGAAIGLQGVAQ